MPHDSVANTPPQAIDDRPTDGPETSDPKAFPIVGVRRLVLETHMDCRGLLGEFHRDSWHDVPRPLQWDFIRSNAGVLRGAHVHRRRWDYLTFLAGEAVIGLCDLRRAQISFKRSMLIEISGDRPAMLLVPPGVIHGIYTRTACIYLYGLTDYYDGTDQDGCVWNDPQLSLDWPNKTPRLNERDRALGGFDALLARFEALGGVSADAR